jgi:WD40 repeat protein
LPPTETATITPTRPPTLTPTPVFKPIASTTVNRIESVRTLHQGSKALTTLTFSEDGNFLAAADEDRIIKVWNADHGAELTTLEGHGGKITTMAFSPDNQYLLSGGKDKTVNLWVIKDGSLKKSFSFNKIVIYTKFINNGEKFFIGLEDGSIHIFSTESLELAIEYPAIQGGATHMAFIEPENRIVLVSLPLTGVYDNEDPFCGVYSEYQYFFRSGNIGESILKAFISNQNACCGMCLDYSQLAISSDGQYYAMYTDYPSIYNSRGNLTRKFIDTFWAQGAQFMFSTDNNLLFQTDSNTIRCWSASEGKQIRQLTENKSMITAIAISKNGKYMASGDYTGNIVIWSVQP